MDASGQFQATPELVKIIHNNLCRQLGLISEDERKASLVILMAALVSGADELSIARDTGLSFVEVSVIAHRLRASKIWVDGQIDMEWGEEDNKDGGDTIFVLHTLVGVGKLTRTVDDASESQAERAPDA